MCRIDQDFEDMTTGTIIIIIKNMIIVVFVRTQSAARVDVCVSVSHQWLHNFTNRYRPWDGSGLGGSETIFGCER